MRLRPKTLPFATLVFGICVALIASACGPGPKNKQLVELERMLKDPKASEVKEAPGASKPYRESRQFRRLSLEAWEEGKEDLSKEYAVLGALRYRTAAAIQDQVQAKERLDKANAKVAESNPEIKTLNEERNKLSDEVSELEREVAVARRKKEEAERMARAQAQRNQRGSGQQTDAATRQALQNKINEAERAREKARDVDAKEHAPAQYNKADNLLSSAKSMLASDSFSKEQIEQANTALELFQKARTEAKPKYEEAKAKQDPAARRAALQKDAEAVYSPTYVMPEPLGVRVILASLFDPGGSRVKAQSQVLLKELVKLAKKYDEFEISIEGFTSKKGGATENLGVSQVRAKTIEDHLTGNGVKASRIEVKGRGENVRFPGESDKNERVEVIFRRSR